MGLKMSKYKAYWLMDFPPIIYWLQIMVIPKNSKLTSVRKISNFTVDKDHRHKK